MANSIQLQLRRGTLAQVQAMTPAMGELVVATDQTPVQIFLGDGATAGGKLLLPAADKFFAVATAAQALVANTWTAVPLGTATYDTNTLFAAGSATIKRAGYYLWSARALFGGGSGGIYQVGLMLNGAISQRGGSEPYAGSANNTVASGSGIVELAAGNVVALGALATIADSANFASDWTALTLAGPF